MQNKEKGQEESIKQELDEIYKKLLKEQNNKMKDQYLKQSQILLQKLQDIFKSSIQSEYEDLIYINYFKQKLKQFLEEQQEQDCILKIKILEQQIRKIKSIEDQEVVICQALIQQIQESLDQQKKPLFLLAQKNDNQKLQTAFQQLKKQFQKAIDQLQLSFDEDEEMGQQLKNQYQLNNNSKNQQSIENNKQLKPQNQQIQKSLQLQSISQEEEDKEDNKQQQQIIKKFDLPDFKKCLQVQRITALDMKKEYIADKKQLLKLIDIELDKSKNIGKLLDEQKDKVGNIIIKTEDAVQCIQQANVSCQKIYNYVQKSRKQKIKAFFALIGLFFKGIFGGAIGLFFGSKLSKVVTDESNEKQQEK